MKLVVPHAPAALLCHVERAEVQVVVQRPVKVSSDSNFPLRPAQAKEALQLMTWLRTEMQVELSPG